MAPSPARGRSTGPSCSSGRNRSSRGAPWSHSKVTVPPPGHGGSSGVRPGFTMSRPVGPAELADRPMPVPPIGQTSADLGVMESSGGSPTPLRVPRSRSPRRGGQLGKPQRRPRHGPDQDLEVALHRWIVRQQEVEQRHQESLDRFISEPKQDQRLAWVNEQEQARLECEFPLARVDAAAILVRALAAGGNA